jgi:hypothetical protein
MRVAILATAAAIFIVGCSHRDPVDRLMERVEHERVPSYAFAPIRLPETASAEQCISYLTNGGGLRVQKILEIRQVHALNQNFTAVRLDTDAGQKIVLLKPLDTNKWYFRIYEAQ